MLYRTNKYLWQGERLCPNNKTLRIIKCLGHGCSIEATADSCEVDARTVQRLLEKAGKRAEDFHRLQLERLDEPLEAVQLDELHGRVAKSPKETKIIHLPKRLRKRRVKKKGVPGFMRRWL